MNIDEKKAAIEAILFAAGREVNIKEIMSSLEIGEEEALELINNLKVDFQSRKSGIQLIRAKDNYQLASKPEYHKYIYPIIDKRNKPNLSNSALETLAIICYNPDITRAQIEEIRGVNADGAIYKLLEYEFIENSGKLNAPGRPMTYRATSNFLKKFGYSSFEELPELPKYKLDENEQIVLDDFSEEDKAESNEFENNESENNTTEDNIEIPKTNLK